MIFSIVLRRTPKSVQSDKAKLKKYMFALTNEAKAKHSVSPTSYSSLYTRIIWFSRKKGGPDVDNIVKPILDALEGVVYLSDSQISQSLSTRIDTKESYTISAINISDEDHQQLTGLLASHYGDILYIEVGQMSDQKAVFGPIDGGMR